MYVLSEKPFDDILSRTAAASIIQSMEEKDVKIREEQLDEILFESATPRTDAVNIINSIDFLALSEMDKVAIELTAIKAVHNRWKELYAHEFLDSEERFLWLEFGLVGLRIMDFDQYVEPIMSLLYINPRREILRKSYLETQPRYLKSLGIEGFDTLKEYILKEGIHSVRDGRDDKIIVFDELVASNLAKQLIAVNGFSFK